MTQIINDHLILVGGKSAAGKSASLRNLRDPSGVFYLNCEAGKKLPFRSGYTELTITEPEQVFEAFEVAETRPDVHTIIIDSLTYLMDMYESLHVLNAVNGMQAWGEFAQFFKRMMQVYVAQSTKHVIFTAHTLDSISDDRVMETKVPIKGSLKNNGIESYFSIVMAAKKMPTSKLADYTEGNPLLNITEEEEMLGFKYVFQTKLTKETVNERLRGPMGMWSNQETFIDNDVQLVMDHLSKYYA